ncbi:MAG: 50S ribosomal protein L11 methyltransferase, partial [Solirubrobacterales bacterium]|nr:50S ribosomal protein L11 methyltransferase [Solirubrobacterales bacterium]
ATTEGSLELLLEVEPAGSVADLGCGSGVLAIAAAKLGFGPVAGVDHERESVEATRGNASANGVEVAAQAFDLLRDGPAPSARTVVANLVRPLLVHLAAGGFGCEAPELLVVSGLLRGEADEIAAAFGAHGLHERARRHGGEWAALTLVR